MCCRMFEPEINLDDVGGENEFLEKERPLWPFTSSPCVVPECVREGSKFSSFNDFKRHWRLIHKPVSTHFKCMNCGRLFANKYHAKSHGKSKFHSGQTIDIKEVNVNNSAYIDSTDYLPYQLGSKEDRANMRIVQRQIARDNRRKEIAERNELYPESTEEVKYQLCRDERVVERQGRLFKDTNMWDSPKKRKRIKLSK